MAKYRWSKHKRKPLHKGIYIDREGAILNRVSFYSEYRYHMGHEMYIDGALAHARITDEEGYHSTRVDLALSKGTRIEYKSNISGSQMFLNIQYPSGEEIVEVCN